MPFSKLTGMIVLGAAAIGDSWIAVGGWSGSVEVDPDPVIGAAGQTGRDGDDEVDRRFGRVRLARLLERGRVADRPRRPAAAMASR